MNVFVAGATGAVGRPLVAGLLQAGHRVVAAARSDARADELRAVGAEPARCDALDRHSVMQALIEAEPDVVVNQLTALPKRLNPRHASRDLALTNRLRREGTRHLVGAAVEVGARRIVSQSIAFLYEPDGDLPRTEQDPVLTNVPRSFADGLRAALELEHLTLETAGLEGVVLRYGFFYGPGTYHAVDGSIAEDVRRRRFPLLGRGAGVASFIHVEDAASAAIAAVERGASGVYNVVDDEPAPARQWLPYYADRLGAPPPRRLPALLGRLVGGAYVYYLACKLPGVSNAAIKRELGWAPVYPSWREGFRAELG